MHFMLYYGHEMHFMSRKYRKEKVVSMSDFMLWLHANYIRPQSDAEEKGDYAFHFDLVRNTLPSAVWSSMDKCLEYAAIRAFSLGLKTGAGLADSVSRPA